jgi:endonuclease YncB( thermonuclease family)
MLAIAALFGALALFWLSTRQFALIWRALIWLAGAGLLGISWLTLAGEPMGFGLLNAVADAFDRGIRESSLLRAITLNAEMVEPAFNELLDFFIVATFGLGLLTALAFTRGEHLEKLLRPSILALMAFIAGSAATLGIVTIGFGGFARPNVFSATASEATSIDLTDADTFSIGDYNLRLYGADALEHDQICYGLNETECGVAAREFLRSLLSSGVQCDQTLSRRGHPRDSFGRALVRCLAPHESQMRSDVAQELIRSGYAVQYKRDDYGYGAAEEEARLNQRGLWAGCTLRPDDWRDETTRKAFLEGSPLPDGVELLGSACAIPVSSP